MIDNAKLTTVFGFFDIDDCFVNLRIFNIVGLEAVAIKLLKSIRM